MASDSVPKGPIFTLKDEESRNAFAKFLVLNSYAFIKIDKNVQDSIAQSYNTFSSIFNSNKNGLICDHNGPYCGYVKTQHLKQSLWFYKDTKQKLFPKIFNETIKNGKNEKENAISDGNEEKILSTFKYFDDIGNDCIHCILEYYCKSKNDCKKCYNLLFENKDNQFTKNDEKETELLESKDNNIKKKDKYAKSRVYHEYRHDYNLSLNNFAAIQYFAKGKKNKNKNKNQVMPCDEHIDYTFLTLISATECGLYVRNVNTFEEIDTNSVMEKNGYKTDKEKSQVIIVITGSTLGRLLFDRVPCMHFVKPTFNKTRISFPFFVYASPNGTIDQSLVDREKLGMRHNAKGEQFNVAQYILDHIQPSVNDF